MLDDIIGGTIVVALYLVFGLALWRWGVLGLFVRLRDGMRAIGHTVAYGRPSRHQRVLADIERRERELGMD